VSSTAKLNEEVRDMTRILATAMVALLVLGGVSSQADVIYDNGDPIGVGILTSDYNYTILDDFELQAGASTLTDFHWYGAYYGDTPTTDDFELYIFDENYNLLHTIDGSLTTRAATGEDVYLADFDEHDQYYYELLIDPLALSSGATYYLGIANSNDAYWAWEYASVLTDSATVWDREHDDFYDDGPGDFAFELTGPGGANGVVPEPASMTLLGLGLVAVAARKKFFA
jgi:hypothetical protein